MPILTPHETYSLHIASVVAASMSIIAGVLASYWFVRMRRSFRHDLIMLLIGSDMFKACWFLLFPAVELVHGTVAPDSIFCNVSGFFLVMSMNASDLAVALITLHTALYIFRGEQGLYPFRKYAYPVIFIFPSLLAGLAFVNKTAYTNTGQFCWLPVEPMWTRLLLSWVPRYFIFASILGISLSLYIYIRILMKRFERVKDAQQEDVTLRDSRSEPPTHKTWELTAPSNVCHGNTQSSISSRRNSKEDGRQFSVSTLNTLHVDLPQAKNYTSKLARQSYQSYQSTKSKLTQPGIEEVPSPYQGSQASNSDLRSPCGAEGLTAPQDAHMQDPQLSPTFSKAPTPPMHSDDSFGGSWAGPTPSATVPRSRKSSLPHIFSVISGRSTKSSVSENPILEEPTLDAASLVKTRETIRRQLRLVLIYPLAYITMWILPFIVHLTSYDKGAPFPMRMVSISCLCLQGFVDALIFSLKEKPWLHTRRLGHGFGDGFWITRSHHSGINTNAGRTREEMMIDGRLAKERRDRELADRQQGSQLGRKATTQWWDNDD